MVKAFLATLSKGEGFWIRFNRTGSGQGFHLCQSVDDVKTFLQTDQRSPDDIYILQQAIDVPAVVRLEFSFGKLLYGLEGAWLLADDRKMLDAFYVRCLHKIVIVRIV